MGTVLQANLILACQIGDDMRLMLPLLALLLVGCLSSQPAAPGEQASEAKIGLSEEDLMRSSAGSAVTMDVVFLNPLQKNEDELVFKVYINTHSLDLSSFRIDSLATFRNSGGLEVSEGFAWVSERDSSHHRSGYLKIPSKTRAGTPLITAETDYILLEVKGVEVTRTFKWGREALEYLK